MPYEDFLKEVQKYPKAPEQDFNKPQEFKTNFMSWMDRLMRPTYASAGLAKEAIAPGEEFNPGQAIWKGLTGQQKTTYSDVLETVGWKPTSKIGKFARGVTGFGLDVLLDPLTYVGVGTLTKTGKLASKTGGLASSIAKQSQAGQRALMSFAGKPIIKGAPVMGQLGKVGVAARAIPGAEKIGTAFGARPLGVDPNVWNKLQKIKQSAKGIQRVGNEKSMQFATGILDDMKNLVKTGKLNDEGVQGLLEAVERRSLSVGLPDSVKPIWEKLTKYADDVAERRVGINKNLLDDTDYNYWLHTLSDTEKATMGRTGADMALKDWVTSSASDVARKYVKVDGRIVKLSKSQQNKLLKKGIKIEQATIGEVNQFLGKPLFSTDIPYTSFEMGRRLSKQESGTHFFRNVLELGFEEPAEGLVKSTAPELQGLWFNPQIAKEIDITKKAFVNNEVTKGFLKTFDNVQNYWKKWTLGPFPAYHVRNMVGNTWNNYLAGVSNPADYIHAGSIMKRNHSGKVLKDWERKLVDKAERLGVLEQGWMGHVLGDGGAPRFYKQQKGFGKKIADIGVMPAEKGLKVGRMFENHARLTHFLAKRKAGYAWDEAALSVKKYLFDYSELTPFEINVMRRLMPFYTWSRKNIPLQLEHILKKPGKTALPIEKVRQGLAQGPEPERKYLPKWLGERMAMRVGKPDKGIARYFPLESWLPIADVGKLARPGQALTELVSPAIKTPVELLMNRSFYFDQPIQRYKGEKKKFRGFGKEIEISPKQEHFVRTIRLFSTIDRILKKPKPTAIEATVLDKWVRELTGVKLYPQRVREMKKWAMYGIDKQIFELKKGFNRAKRNKNYKEAARIQKTIRKLERIK